MPTKKKASFHSKKPVTPKGEESTSQPKEDRPVMQVVQIPEDAAVSPDMPQPVAAPVVPTAPEDAPAVTPEKSLPQAPEPVTSDKPEPVVVEQPDTKETPIEKTETPITSPVVTPQTGSVPTVSPTPTASETFAEELPPVKESSKKGLIALLIILLLVVCGGFGGYLYMKGNLKLPTTITTFLNMKKTPTQVTVTPTTVATPTPTPVAVDKSKYTIQVLNGSGVVGEAAKVKSSLTAAGYTVSAIGNAATSDFTQTEISAKTSVDNAFVTALTTELSKSYSVSSNLVALPAQATTDIIVTIGSQTAQ